MGYQVEYLIDVLPARARGWLSALPGWWAEPESPDDLPDGEFQWGDLSLHVELGLRACRLRVPQIKYSWLIADHAPSLKQIARLEDWLCGSLPGVRAVRVDEFLRQEWESRSGREWQEWPNAVGALRDWLLSSRQDARHFRLLANEE
jgi:hypothetical protein